MQTFFGLTIAYNKAVYESIFSLMYYMKMSFIEVYNMPRGLRDFFLNKLAETKEAEAKAMEKGSKK